MPEDEGLEKGEEIMLDEDIRDKKSKGSTTVCLEIKSDPTKPPSTICGPEIKPNSPFDPHNMYSLGQNDGNSFYYTEPQPDKTIWSLNPLHDPMYYSAFPNYKDQSTNRGDTRQNHHKHNGNGSDKQKMKSPSHVTSSDKPYQSKENSMSQNNILSVEDKPKTLKTMPGANYIQDNYGIRELGQTSRSMLSGNNDVPIDVLENSKNKFNDLDLNLDAEMSSDTNTYIDPSGISYNQYDPNINIRNLGSGFGNDFNSDQTVFYPFTNYENNGGIFKMTEQAAEDESQISNEPLVGLNLGGEMMQPFLEENNSGDFQKSASLYNDQLENMGSSEGLNQESAESINPSLIAAPRGAYEYYPEYPNREYPYRPTTYPYVPPRRYPYRPNYGSNPYNPDCRSGRCRSAGSTSLDSFPIFGMNTFNTPQSRSDGTFESTPLTTDTTFRGNAYYSGQPYLYRPPYEYQGTHSYPYSSRPYPYRPSPYSYSSGYTYPYDQNCRTADGRSCREAEDERRAESSDVNISPMQNYIDPTELQDSSAFQLRSAVESYSLQNSSPSDNEVLGSSHQSRTYVPVVEPHIAPAHTPVGLACNLVHGMAHAPMIPTHSVLPLTPGIGIGTGQGHLHHSGGKRILCR